ncbi:MAG: SDH family Clp fold serine proteinase [Candidatus Eiseniibacteriota bacterium]
MPGTPCRPRGKWTHDYPITLTEAQGLGLNARAEMPADVLQLMSLYPQPVRHQPAVEYLPYPRRTEDSQRRPD